MIPANSHLPDGEIPTLAFPKAEFAKRGAEVSAAFETARAGDVFAALYANGRCVGESIGVGTAVADRALAAGAVAAGISGDIKRKNALEEYDYLFKECLYSVKN